MARFQIQGAPSHARRCGSGSRRGATGPGPARYRGSCRGNRRTTRNALARNRCAGPGARCRRPAAAPAARSPAGSSQCGSPTPLRPGRHRGSQRTDRERNQPLYLGGELRRDLVAEPPFLCPVVPAGGAVAAGFGGRASQIASLTATICSLTCAKRDSWPTRRAPCPPPRPRAAAPWYPARPPCASTNIAAHARGDPLARTHNWACRSGDSSH